MSSLAVESSRVEGVTLPFRPEQVARLRVQAVYLEGQIDLRAFQKRRPDLPVCSADPLILEPWTGSFVALYKFGGVVFWNCRAADRKGFLAELRSAMGSGHDEVLEDSIDVLVGAAENVVTFNEVSLRALTLPRMSILSLALAQSVALDHLEREVASALSRFEPVVTGLEATGNLKLPVRDALRAIGFSLKVRSSVLANLTLFDKPPETWESEMLERLDSQLYDFFDLEERLSAINQKVAYLTDMSSMMTNVLSQRRSWQLEITVIVLILLEVLIFIWSLVRH